METTSIAAIARHLNLYAALSGLSFPKSYLGKFLLVAFVGVHVPLLTLVGYIAFGASSFAEALPILVVALLATLTGTFATLLIQGKLLAPVLLSSQALDRYTRSGEVPTLPVAFDDEAGRLMTNTQDCITKIEDLLRMKNNFLGIMSHDVRSPLTATILAADVLEMELDPARRTPHWRKNLYSRFRFHRSIS